MKGNLSTLSTLASSSALSPLGRSPVSKGVNREGLLAFTSHQSPPLALSQADTPHPKITPQMLPLMRRTCVVLGHGLLSQGREWQPIVHTLARLLPGVRFDLLDMRNHGESFHSRSHTLEDLSGDRRHHIDQHCMDKDLLFNMGHSMSGSEVMYTATYNRHPKTVGDIVLDMTPHRPAGAQRYVTALLDKYLTLADNRHESFDDLMTAYEAKRFPSAKGDRLERERTLHCLFQYDESQRCMRPRVNLKVLRQSLNDILFKSPARPQTSAIAIDVSQNMLILRGEKSPYNNKIGVQQQASSFPNAQVAQLPGVGHSLQFEAPDQVVQHVLRFILDRLSVLAP